jgi:predicted RNA-binding protein with PUA-like domain
MHSNQQFWLVKQEPEAYSWSAFVADGRTAWTGVRNFQARNNLSDYGRAGEARRKKREGASRAELVRVTV